MLPDPVVTRCRIGTGDEPDRNCRHAHGQRTADVLAHTAGLKLAAIFSPEHGFAAVLDTTQTMATLMTGRSHGRTHL